MMKKKRLGNATAFDNIHASNGNGNVKFDSTQNTRVKDPQIYDWRE